MDESMFHLPACLSAVEIWHEADLGVLLDLANEKGEEAGLSKFFTEKVQLAVELYQTEVARIYFETLQPSAQAAADVITLNPGIPSIVDEVPRCFRVLGREALCLDNMMGVCRLLGDKPTMGTCANGLHIHRAQYPIHDWAWRLAEDKVRGLAAQRAAQMNAAVREVQGALKAQKALMARETGATYPSVEVFRRFLNKLLYLHDARGALAARLVARDVLRSRPASEPPFELDRVDLRGCSKLVRAAFIDELHKAWFV
jgi:hypothetical protein